jgi:general secretion pathway protein H
MPTSTPNKQAGFTLVELMVVLFLIGLAASAVVLTISSATRSSGTQAEQFAARVAALRDRAVVEGQPLAFWLRPSGYGFERRAQARGGGTRWQAFDAKPFQTVNWPSSMKASVSGGRALRIAFDANGIPSAPMDIALSGDNRTYRIQMDAAGNVNVAR